MSASSSSAPAHPLVSATLGASPRHLESAAVSASAALESGTESASSSGAPARPLVTATLGASTRHLESAAVGAAPVLESGTESDVLGPPSRPETLEAPSNSETLGTRSNSKTLESRSSPEALESCSPSEPNGLAFATRAIHGGLAPDPATGAILTPLYQSTTYVQEAVGRDKGYTYSRAANPTVAALERNLGALEDALPAVCFGTGMSAITTLFLATLKAGERVVCSDVVYGGTVRLLRALLEPFGVRADFVDTSNLALLEQALAQQTRLLFLESPANPTLKLTDLAAAARLAKAGGVLTVVDNTFLTPVLQDAFGLGADVVVHSTTKYIEGHNATVGGALLTRDPALRGRFDFVRKSLGTIQSPLEAWLTLRGIKTLELRMQRHSESALRVAQWLESRSEVERVHYPWLPSFPQHDLARRQQRSGGGIVSFTLHGGIEAGMRLMNRVRLCALAENLGAAETLVTHPASMTHAFLSKEERERIGIADGLVRLSVGLEDPLDIIADLEQALLAHVELRDEVSSIEAGAIAAKYEPSELEDIVPKTSFEATSIEPSPVAKGETR